MSRWWVSASLSALPLIHHLSQVFGNVIAYPGRKIPIEPETLSALCNQKAAHVLGILSFSSTTVMRVSSALCQSMFIRLLQVTRGEGENRRAWFRAGYG